MFFKKTLQASLMLSVLVIVSFTMMLIMVFGLSMERSRLQKNEINRIYYETDALAKRLGPLVYNGNLRTAMIALVNTMHSDPGMLFFQLRDMNKVLLVSDRQGNTPGNADETASLTDPEPVSVNTSHTSGTEKRFHVYISKLNRDIRIQDQLRAQAGETVFDTTWDIAYMGEKLGNLRVGFSRKKLKESLVFHFWMVLGTGCAILVVTMLMIYLVIKRSLKPFGHFVSDISSLKDTTHGRSLKKQLDSINWKDYPGAVHEAKQLKAALKRVKELFNASWNQLEDHRNNLEQLVDERTRELHATNEKLKKQMEERKEIENRLVNAQKLESIGTLAGGIAHDFNNLFMAISGYAALIQASSDKDNPSYEKAVKIRRLVSEGADTISQLLGFARSGKYAPAALNINEVIQGNLPIFYHNRKDIEIITLFDDNIRTVFADRSQMDHVIMNLFLNASEAMLSNGKLTIETQNTEFSDQQVGMDRAVSGAFVKFAFADTGHGMSAEVVSRVFDPFFTTKDMGEGTGLGLASVYGIVENHSGFITVESTPGTGSKFSVYLPAMEKS